jgi:hypothetical protein
MSKVLKLLAGVLLVSSTRLVSVVSAQDVPADIPADVMEFVVRRSSCLEWSRKQSDPERKAQLSDAASVLRSLKCDEVGNDESLLRQKYAVDPDALKALDSTWTKIVKRLPVRTPVSPDTNR